MGALVNKWTHVNIPLVVSKITDQTGHTNVTTVQTILDQLMPGLVPLLLTFACMWLLRKSQCAVDHHRLLRHRYLWLLDWPAGPVIVRIGRGNPGFLCVEQEMSLTDAVLMLFIALLLLYSLYDEFGMDLLKGKTRLKVALKRRNRLDSLIFVGLIAILIYRNVTTNGAVLTTYLLISLALLAIYISYIRTPKMVFKAQGFSSRTCLSNITALKP